VKKFLTPGTIPFHTGHLANISLEQVQMEVGIGTPLFESSFDEYGHLLTFCWIKILWPHFFLWMNQISLCNPEQILPKLQCKGDFFIME
jgi:hypothetical protein